MKFSPENLVPKSLVQLYLVPKNLVHKNLGKINLVHKSLVHESLIHKNLVKESLQMIKDMYTVQYVLNLLLIKSMQKYIFQVCSYKK